MTLLKKQQNTFIEKHMGNRQTAVEWFFDNLKNHEIQAEHYELYRQALKMQELQIINAYGQGVADEAGEILDATKDAEEYYNRTYNK